MKLKAKLFWMGLIVLMVLHHDWWFWDDGRLVFGFLPVGLAYHALVSLAAGGLWALAVFVIWPELFEGEPESVPEKAEAGEPRRATD
ncbi:MAG: DUF3311 domain-containing protein [Planctomycetota bacterium]|jgi:hypothetical protein